MGSLGREAHTKSKTASAADTLAYSRHDGHFCSHQGTLPLCHQGVPKDPKESTSAPYVGPAPAAQPLLAFSKHADTSTRDGTRNARRAPYPGQASPGKPLVSIPPVRHQAGRAIPRSARPGRDREARTCGLRKRTARTQPTQPHERFTPTRATSFAYSLPPPRSPVRESKAKAARRKYGPERARRTRKPTVLLRARQVAGTAALVTARASRTAPCPPPPPPSLHSKRFCPVLATATVGRQARQPTAPQCARSDASTAARPTTTEDHTKSTWRHPNHQRPPWWTLLPS